MILTTWIYIYVYDTAFIFLYCAIFFCIVYAIFTFLYKKKNLIFRIILYSLLNFKVGTFFPLIVNIFVKYMWKIVDVNKYKILIFGYDTVENTKMIRYICEYFSRRTLAFYYCLSLTTTLYFLAHKRSFSLLAPWLFWHWSVVTEDVPLPWRKEDRRYERGAVTKVFN